MKDNLKIDYVSDLHLEINGSAQDCVKPRDSEGDILLLVGDITCYRYFKPERTDSESRSMKKRFQKFIQDQPHKEIFLIPGNHEYYGFYFEGADKWMDGILRSIDPRLRILQNELIIRNGVAIFGATLWTNMNNYNPLTMMAVGNGMRDFEIIGLKRDEDVTYEDRHRMGRVFKNRFGTETAYREHCVTMANLRQYYDMFSDMPFVVATHHGPSFKSHSLERFGDTEIKYGYLTEYGDWISDSKIDYWIHGHTHHNVDYKLGNCQVTSAMYGYVGWDRKHYDRKLEYGRIEI